MIELIQVPRHHLPGVPDANDQAKRGAIKITR
jgi:hypothetical protein